MSLFQLISLPLVAALLIRTVVRLCRGGHPRRVLLLWTAIWLTAGVAIAQPGITMRLAAFLGIGRGADLLLYLLTISFLLSNVHMLAKFHRLESEMTKLVRYMALRNPVQQQSHSNHAIRHGEE